MLVGHRAFLCVTKDDVRDLMETGFVGERSNRVDCDAIGLRVTLTVAVDQIIVLLADAKLCHCRASIPTRQS
jgi:hypothetical protein